MAVVSGFPLGPQKRLFRAAIILTQAAIKISETYKKNTKGGWREGGRRERPSASKRLTIEEAISKDFLDKDHHCHLKNMAQNARGAFLLCEGFLKGGFLKIFKNFQTSQT